jgi:hypothetical protein
VFSHHILRFKIFRRFKFVQKTTTSHCYITLRDTSLKLFIFSVISKTSSSFSSPHFGQLARYSDTYNQPRTQGICSWGAKYPGYEVDL